MTEVVLPKSILAAARRLYDQRFVKPTTPQALTVLYRADSRFSGCSEGVSTRIAAALH